MKAEVNAEADAALTDYAPATAAALVTVEGKVDAVDVVVDAIAAVLSGITSLADLGVDATQDDLDAALRRAFRAVFDAAD